MFFAPRPGEVRLVGDLNDPSSPRMKGMLTCIAKQHETLRACLRISSNSGAVFVCPLENRVGGSEV